MLLTLALQVFSSCEVSTDMTNSHMPVLEKYVNHLYDVTEADVTTVEAFTCKIDMYGAIFHILYGLWLLVDNRHIIFMVSLFI